MQEETGHCGSPLSWLLFVYIPFVVVPANVANLTVFQDKTNPTDRILVSWDKPAGYADTITVCNLI